MEHAEESLIHDKGNLNWIDVLIILMLILIFVFGILGNILVCYVCKDTWRKSTKDFLILTLAVVDLFSSIVTPAVFIYWQINGHKKWHFGKIGCQIFPSLTRIPARLSIGIILIISVNLCRVISPFMREFKKQHIKYALLIMVVICVLSELPYMLNAKIAFDHECLVPNAGIPGYIYPVLVIGGASDLTVLVTFSFVLYFVYNVLYNSCKEVRRQSSINTAPALKMFITMLTTLIILVFPRDIFQLVYLFSWLSKPGIKYTRTLIDINAFLKILHSFSCVSNIFIYAKLHVRFRRRLLNILHQLTSSQEASTETVLPLKMDYVNHNRDVE